MPLAQLQREQTIGVQGRPFVESTEGSFRALELRIESGPGTGGASSLGGLSRVSEPTRSATRELSSQQLLDYIHRGHTTSTKVLVDTSNTTQNAEDQVALYEWVRGYVDWFAARSIARLDEDVAREYAYLAHIQPRTRKGKALLCSYLYSFYNIIDQNRFGENYLIQSLSEVLEKIDSSAFRGPADLIDMGNVLLGKIEPGSNEFTRNNYSKHESILTALHSILLLIYQLDQEGWSAEGSLYQKFRDSIEDIKGASRYYPVTYYSQLLESSLETLKHVDPPTLSQRIDNIFEVVKTVASVYQVARGLLSLEIDVQSWEEAYRQLKDSYTQLSGGINALLESCSEQGQSWYNHLLEFTFKSMADFDLEDESDQAYEAFEKKLTDIEQLYQNQKDERLSLRYGVVRQLTPNCTSEL